MRYAIFALFTKPSDDKNVYQLRQESVIIFVNMVWEIRTRILSSRDPEPFCNGMTILAMYRAALRRHLSRIYPDDNLTF